MFHFSPMHHKHTMIQTACLGVNNSHLSIWTSNLYFFPCTVYSVFRSQRYSSKIKNWSFQSSFLRFFSGFFCFPSILNILKCIKVCQTLAEALLFSNSLCTKFLRNTCACAQTEMHSYPDQFLPILYASTKSHFLRMLPLFQFLRSLFHVFS